VILKLKQRQSMFIH